MQPPSRAACNENKLAAVRCLSYPARGPAGRPALGTGCCRPQGGGGGLPGHGPLGEGSGDRPRLGGWSSSPLGLPLSACCKTNLPPRWVTWGCPNKTPQTGDLSSRYLSSHSSGSWKFQTKVWTQMVSSEASLLGL